MVWASGVESARYYRPNARDSTAESSSSSPATCTTATTFSDLSLEAPEIATPSARAQGVDPGGVRAHVGVPRAQTANFRVQKPRREYERDSYTQYDGTS
jgi:hypothetical protein